MELRHLRYFVAVAEELHFRHAAERLYVAQPAVSEQVRKLEQELGVRLFDRTNRSVSLTVPGAALLDEARGVLRQAEIAQQAARSARDREVGRLRIGYMPDALPAPVLQALVHFKAAAPGIELAFASGRPLQLVDDLRKQRLDVALVSLPAPVEGLLVTPLGADRAVAAVPEGHPMGGHAALSPERIGDGPLVLLPRVANPAFYDSVLACWREQRLSPRPVEVTEPLAEHALLAVAAGAGIGVLPESAAARHSVSGVRIVPLTPAPACELAAVTRDEASTSVAALIGLARRAVQAPERAKARALARA